MQRSLGLVIVVLVLMLSACGGDDKDNKDATLDPNTPAGRGAAIFRENCATCHDVKGERVIVGPALTGLANRAGERIEGVSAEDYLIESILSPNDYIVEDFTEGAMPQNFARDLSSEEIDNLIVYLLTLK